MKIKRQNQRQKCFEENERQAEIKVEDKQEKNNTTKPKKEAERRE